MFYQDLKFRRLKNLTQFYNIQEMMGTLLTRQFIFIPVDLFLKKCRQTSKLKTPFPILIRIEQRDIFSFNHVKIEFLRSVFKLHYVHFRSKGPSPF